MADEEKSPKIIFDEDWKQQAKDMKAKDAASVSSPSTGSPSTSSGQAGQARNETNDRTACGGQEFDTTLRSTRYVARELKMEIGAGFMRDWGVLLML